MMMRKAKQLYPIILMSILVLTGGTVPSYGSQVVPFGPDQTKITGSIKYTVIGQYRANFNRFNGEITVDPVTEEIKGVYLEIDVETIESSCQWCDKIVRSKQLLHTEKHPKIVFQSSSIIKEGNEYRVKGTLDMHGIKNEMVLPFEAAFFQGSDSGQKTMNVSGTWIIQRKDFDIVWNKVLDRGGVLVGNDITVDWSIQSVI
ncbi:MAG: YceI family protein [Candidatus Omnitrophica bacterium]|nr:YceI family protein [Candidatus Omnitrophota bacterium]